MKTSSALSFAWLPQLQQQQGLVQRAQGRVTRLAACLGN